MSVEHVKSAGFVAAISLYITCFSHQTLRVKFPANFIPDFKSGCNFEPIFYSIMQM